MLSGTIIDVLMSYFIKVAVFTNNSVLNCEIKVNQTHFSV